MIKSDIKSLIQQFIEFVTTPGDKTDEQMLEFLDRIFSAVHTLEYEFDETEHPDPPDVNAAELRKTIEKIFPEYGLYNLPEHTLEKIGKAGCVVGDAIDDLVDACSDMLDVIWCWNHNSPEDGLFYFHNGYLTHWGLHLRDLQFYVFRKLYIE